jgi:hypothetical protein
MKKTIILGMTLCLTITLFTVTPVSADRFWPGVAVGVGSAIVLSQLINAPRDHYSDYRPARVYGHPSPAYRERWVPASYRFHDSYRRHSGYDRWEGHRAHRDRRY